MCKNEGLVFHSMAQAIQLMNSLSYGENEKDFENPPTLCRKITFQEICPKSFSKDFLLIFEFSESCPRTHRAFSETQF